MHGWVVAPPTRLIVTLLNDRGELAEPTLTEEFPTTTAGNVVDEEVKPQSKKVPFVRRYKAVPVDTKEELATVTTPAVLAVCRA